MIPGFDPAGTASGEDLSSRSDLAASHANGGLNVSDFSSEPRLHVAGNYQNSGSLLGKGFPVDSPQSASTGQHFSNGFGMPNTSQLGVNLNLNLNLGINPKTSPSHGGNLWPSPGPSSSGFSSSAPFNSSMSMSRSLDDGAGNGEDRSNLGGVGRPIQDFGNAQFASSMSEAHANGSGSKGEGQAQALLFGSERVNDVGIDQDQNQDQTSRVVENDREGFIAKNDDFRHEMAIGAQREQQHVSGYLPANPHRQGVNVTMNPSLNGSPATAAQSYDNGSIVANNSNGYVNGYAPNGSSSSPAFATEQEMNGLVHSSVGSATGTAISTGVVGSNRAGVASENDVVGQGKSEEEWVVSQTSEGRRFWYSRKTRESHWYNPVIVLRGAEKIRNEQVVDQETIKHLQLFQAEKRHLKDKKDKADKDSRKAAAVEARKAKQKAEAMKKKAAEIARQQAMEAERLERERKAEAERIEQEKRAKAARLEREKKAKAARLEREARAKAERERYERERLASFAKAKHLLRRYLDSIGYESLYVSDKMIDDAILYVRPTRKGDPKVEAFEALVKRAQVPFTCVVPEEEKTAQSDYAAQKKLEQERAMNSEFFGIDEKSLTPEQLAVKEEFIKFFSVKSKTKSAEQDAELTRKRIERKKKLEEKAAVLRASSTRPKRRGKSRLVNVDGHMILKENNYDMEEGIKTIGKAVVSTAKKIRAARSAFNFFSTKTAAQLRKDFPNIEFREVQREVAARWKLITAEGRLEFDNQAADDRIRYAREVSQAAAEEETKRREALQAEAERKSKEAEAKAALSRSKGEDKDGTPSASSPEAPLLQPNFGEITGKSKGPPRPTYYHMIDAAVIALGARAAVNFQEVHDWLQRSALGKLFLLRFRLDYDQKPLDKAIRKAINRGDLEPVDVAGKNAPSPTVIMSIDHIGQLVQTKPLSMIRREEKAAKKKHKARSASSVAQQKFQRLELERVRHNNRMKFDIFHGSKRQYAYLIRNMSKIESFITPDVKRKIQRAAELLRIMGYSDLLDKDPTGYEDWNAQQKALAAKDTAKEEPEARIKRKAIAQPKDIVGGTMRPYQLEGLCWMVSTFENGVNAILADEMGLGKTLQTISLITHIKYEMKLSGPFLIIVPLSVLTAWANEFKKWSPRLIVIKMHSSSKVERDRLKKEVLSDFSKFDVVLTTYEMAISSNMRYVVSTKMFWRYVVIDEGHKIKNHETDLAQVVRSINCQGRLLLTGTPLQNNLHELWALLNYLYPQIFISSEPFDECFNLTKQMVNQDMLAKAHYLLRPFVLRRTKSEVAQRLPPKEEIEIKVGLSALQLDWYKKLLQRDAKLLERVEASLDSGGADGSANDFKRLQSLMMQLRKCCNHPFLFAANAALAAQHDLVKASGKLSVLDRLLKKLQEKGHRVVVFSQFTSMLDILQEFCTARGYKFSRLDGSTNRVQRAIDIMEYNKADSSMFLYLMSTRAGGLGINLYTADTVVLYDSDWNPQVDLQAMDRVHRIGQKKPVHVYRLVTKDTVEERVVERAKKKLYLDKMVNRGSTSQAEKLESLSKGEMLKLLKFGASAVVDSTSETSNEISDEQLESIIDRTKLQTQMNDGSKEDTSLNALDFDGTAESLSIRKLNGVDYSEPAEPTKRRRGEAIDDGFGKAGKRQKKSRYITTKEGYNILKANDYTLKEGEKSVFSQELRGRKKGNMFKRSGRQIAGRDFQNEGHCLICWDGGDLLLCDQCCAAYHEHCLTPAQLPKKKASGRQLAVSWGCPHHDCKVCGRKAQAAGGMLFRCTECPNSFCEDHCPFETASLNENGREPRFEALGQVKPAQAYFMQCSKNCSEFHRIRVSQGVLAAIQHVQARLANESTLAKE